VQSLPLSYDSHTNHEEAVPNNGFICGADGCKAGWVVLRKDLSSGSISWQVYPTPHDLVFMEPSPLILSIDIPIGLPDCGPRACDQEARKLLGPGRASSVFPAPIRPVLIAKDYEEACSFRRQLEGKSMSRQSWAIVHKIREVDEVLRRDPTLQARIREVHPEVSFYFLSGQRALQHSKKTKEGKAERRRLLESVFAQWVEAAIREKPRLACNEDDILDAFAALWTAERILTGKSRTIPAIPPKDSCKLRMEIVA